MNKELNYIRSSEEKKDYDVILSFFKENIPRGKHPKFVKINEANMLLIIIGIVGCCFSLGLFMVSSELKKEWYKLFFLGFNFIGIYLMIMGIVNYSKNRKLIEYGALYKAKIEKIDSNQFDQNPLCFTVFLDNDDIDQRVNVNLPAYMLERFSLLFKNEILIDIVYDNGKILVPLQYVFEKIIK